MSRWRSEAHVLGRIPYSETSWIVTLFTRSEGCVRAVAKGGRRPRSAFAGALEPFSLVEVQLSGKEGASLWSLTGADLREGSLELFADWRRAGVLYAALELLERGLPEGSREEETYRLAGHLREGLASGVDPVLAWPYFLLWFATLHGFFPPPRACSHWCNNSAVLTSAAPMGLAGALASVEKSRQGKRTK